MNIYEIFLIFSLSLGVFGLFLMNLIKKDDAGKCIFFITSNFYRLCYGKYRLFIREEIKDKVVFVGETCNLIFFGYTFLLIILGLCYRQYKLFKKEKKEKFIIDNDYYTEGSYYEYKKYGNEVY